MGPTSIAGWPGTQPGCSGRGREKLQTPINKHLEMNCNRWGNKALRHEASFAGEAH
jgi:hypothetical protein